jgi:hypothetical protein
MTWLYSEVVLIRKHERRPARGGVSRLSSGLDLASCLPAAVFGDSHPFSARRQLDEYRALAACDQTLSRAGAKAVELAPFGEREHAIVIDTGLMQRSSAGHLGVAIHWKSPERR